MKETSSLRAVPSISTLKIHPFKELIASDALATEIGIDKAEHNMIRGVFAIRLVLSMKNKMKKPRYCDARLISLFVKGS